MLVVPEWVANIRLDSEQFGTSSQRGTKEVLF